MVHIESVQNQINTVIIRNQKVYIHVQYVLTSGLFCWIYLNLINCSLRCKTLPSWWHTHQHVILNIKHVYLPEWKILLVSQPKMGIFLLWINQTTLATLLFHLFHRLPHHLHEWEKHTGSNLNLSGPAWRLWKADIFNWKMHYIDSFFLNYKRFIRN